MRNGLVVLVLPVHRVPVVICDLYYPAGSYDEPPGLTGLAHFVEHMLFKGTERFPKGQIDRLVMDAAGQSNAETSEDFTHYWFAFPLANWELALAIEADRMNGIRFDPEEVESERRVIVEERARELNSPQGRLDEAHLALTYLRHPYRNPILGWPDDLARISPADLQAFYGRHYGSRGAVLVVAGDVEPEKALDSIERSFGRVACEREAERRPGAIEPAQVGRRDFTLFEAETAPRGLLGWRTVPRGHPDAPALDVLADLLSCGRQSRLWQSLIETAKTATWLDASHCVARRAGQFFIQIEATAEREIAGIEREVAAEIGRIAKYGPTTEELERSRRRLESAWRWECDDLAALAGGLGVSALWGDWRDWPREHRAALALDADDVRRAVCAHLVDANLTAGWSLPRPEIRSDRSLVSYGHAPAAARDVVYADAPVVRTPIAHKLNLINDTHEPRTGLPVVAVPAPGVIAPRLVDYRPKRLALDNGLRVVLERRPDCGVVALELYVDAGLLRESTPGVACLTGRMLEEGTRSRSASDLAEAIEGVGGALEVGATGVSVRVRKEELGLAMELAADVAIRPAFPDDAVDWLAQRIAADLEVDMEDPAFRADLSFRGMVYGGHPLARDPRGGIREIRRLTRRELIEHHGRYFTPENATLVVVGDFDPRRVGVLCRQQFGEWAPSGRLPAPLPVPSEPSRARVRRIDHQGEQIQLVMGHLGIARNHPDFAALSVLDHIFGSGPGFCDRLGRILRDELGLVYSVGGGITDSADVAPGMFRVHASTTPAAAERVVAIITEQIGAMHAGEFSDDEFERARRYVAGSWLLDFQTVEQRAERLLDLARCGLDLEEPREWPGRVAGITADLVRAAARTHITPGAISRVELGPIPGRERARAECA